MPREVLGLSPSARRRFRRAVIAWGREHARSFFWRRKRLQPFQVLVLEVLLAKTRAEVAEPVVVELLRRYPTAERLAAARIRDLERMLRPLGLFRKRARGLKRLASQLVDRHGGEVPSTERDLRRLSYVGRYAASATLCFAFQKRRAIVDANVVRLLSRYYGLTLPPAKIEADERYWTLAAALLPRTGVERFNWYLLDLGAMVCKPIAPLCNSCCFARTCAARKATCTA